MTIWKNQNRERKNEEYKVRIENSKDASKIDVTFKRINVYIDEDLLNHIHKMFLFIKHINHSFKEECKKLSPEVLEKNYNLKRKRNVT